MLRNRGVLPIRSVRAHRARHPQGSARRADQRDSRGTHHEERGCAGQGDQAAKTRKVKPWTVEEARQFLESARDADDTLYAAYVLILVLGLRNREVLSLTLELYDL